jgi:hypothetical protein
MNCLQSPEAKRLQTVDGKSVKGRSGTEGFRRSTLARFVASVLALLVAMSSFSVPSVAAAWFWDYTLQNRHNYPFVSERAKPPSKNSFFIIKVDESYTQSGIFAPEYNRSVLLKIEKVDRSDKSTVLATETRNEGECWVTNTLSFGEHDQFRVFGEMQGPLKQHVELTVLVEVLKDEKASRKCR